MNSTRELEGGCYCGNLKLQVSLTGSPESLSPRSCTCDFCRKNGAAYLSDPAGSLTLAYCDQATLGRFRQEPGGAAEFLFCRECAVLVAVIHQADDRLYGAVNASVLHHGDFGSPMPVAPHKLSREQRLERWKELWFKEVQLLRQD
jgi:hypothetical protein